MIPDNSAKTNSREPIETKVTRIVPNLLLLVATVAICLGLLEYAVRRLFPLFTLKGQVPFQLTTNNVALGRPMETVRQATPKGDYDVVFRFNADGFRDSKRLSEATEDDWFALGDSFTMGWGLKEEQRFSNLLEHEFQQQGAHARVFNIAIPENIIGYQRLLKYAETHGAKVRHLVVGICMENDLRDYSDGKSSWDPAADAAMTKKNAMREWLKRHCALYVGASYLFQKSEFTRGLLIKMGIARSIDELSGKNVWNEAVIRTSREELVKLVSGRDAMILIIPARRLWTGDNIDVEQRVHTAFVKQLEEARLNVLDLKPALEQGGDPLGNYFKTDPHWNARGHAVAARELANAIGITHKRKSQAVN